MDSIQPCTCAHTHIPHTYTEYTDTYSHALVHTNTECTDSIQLWACARTHTVSAQRASTYKKQESVSKHKHREKASILCTWGLCMNTYSGHHGKDTSEGKAHISDTKKNIQDLDSYIAESLQRTLEGNESLMEPKEKISSVPWATAHIPPPWRWKGEHGMGRDGDGWGRMGQGHSCSIR